MNRMPTLRIQRYGKKSNDTYLGFIEPKKAKERTWGLFLRLDGKAPDLVVY